MSFFETHCTFETLIYQMLNCFLAQLIFLFFLFLFFFFNSIAESDFPKSCSNIKLPIGVNHES